MANRVASSAEKYILRLASLPSHRCTSASRSSYTGLASAQPNIQSTRKRSRAFASTSIRRADRENSRQTHYDLFPTALPSGPPPHGPFDVDLKALRKEYLGIQAHAHPDRHPAEMKTRAEALSARINEAYRTLENPLKRAQYILSMRGIDVSEDETMKVEDPDLLMEVLETRETIEEAEEESDLDALRETNDARVRDSVKKLASYFSDEDIDSAKSEAVKLRYWINIKESIDNWEKGKPVTLQH